MNDHLKNEILEFCKKYAYSDKKIIDMNSSIREDLEIDGDDAFFFFEDFEKNFNIEIFSKFDFQKYFHNENEIITTLSNFGLKKIRKIEQHFLIKDLFNFFDKT